MGLPTFKRAICKWYLVFLSKRVRLMYDVVRSCDMNYVQRMHGNNRRELPYHK